MIQSTRIASRKAEAQMPKLKHYSPQLSRELVSQLYHKAKAEGVPMTVLANRLMEEELESKKRINKRRTTENQHMTEPK